STSSVRDRWPSLSSSAFPGGPWTAIPPGPTTTTLHSCGCSLCSLIHLSLPTVGARRLGVRVQPFSWLTQRAWCRDGGCGALGGKGGSGNTAAALGEGHRAPDRHQLASPPPG